MDRATTELDRIQRWMQAVVTDANGIGSGLRSETAHKILPGTEDHLEDLVLPSSQLSAAERLRIYADMYFSRLVDILAEEFPTVRHLFGKELFEQVVKDYVTRHPSTHYSLTRLGRKFPGYLAGEAHSVPHLKFASAVATVERAMEDVFDERFLEPIKFEVLAAIPMERWGDVRLRTIPALRLLQLDYPVNDFMTAVRDKRHMDVPARILAFTSVYRRNYRVVRVDLDAQRFTLLAALQKGESLGTAVELCASLPEVDTETLADVLNGWFREWSSEGIFCSAQLDT